MWYFTTSIVTLVAIRPYTNKSNKHTDIYALCLHQRESIFYIHCSFAVFFFRPRFGAVCSPTISDSFCSAPDAKA